MNYDMARKKPQLYHSGPQKEVTMHALRFFLSLSIAFLLFCPLRAMGQATATGRTTGIVQISVALVDDEMNVRPVPLLGLVLVSESRDSVRVRTDSKGNASATLQVGPHTVASAGPTAFHGKNYSWDLSITVASGTNVLQLTNDNASVQRNDVQQNLPSSRFDSAAGLFKKYAQGVFRIQAGLSHGTGFLADTLGGVIITNSHVIESTEPTELSVILETGKRIKAQLLARDSEADIAVLRVNHTSIEGRPRIRLQPAAERAEMAPGQRLVALGYPLHQELVMTSGILSSVRAGAVISDVNINPGNSGGPLLDSDGTAVAVNTFGDFGKVGAGVSGSILIERAGPALSRASVEMQMTPSPSADLLPVVPEDRLAIATLKAFAETADPRIYDDYTMAFAGFNLMVQTPPKTFVALKKYENEVAKDRKKREAQAGLSDAEKYSQVREYRDWSEYVGAETTPVVSISVVPVAGETGGSTFARMMFGAGIQAKYKFRGDVKGVQLFRNFERVEPIKGGHAPTVVYNENQWISLKDVADQGFYVFDAEVFRPDSSGAPPSIVIAVRDLKNPKKLKCCELPRTVVSQAWNDFEEFYKEQRPTKQFLRSDPKAAEKRKSAFASGFLKGDAEWPILH